MSDRILVVSPHPDDEAIGCGGVLRKHADLGHEILVVFLTSGELGGHGRNASETLKLREREARTAAGILGIQHIEFWRENDGALRVSRGLVARMTRLIRSFDPARIYVPHEKEQHPDHRAAARLVRAARRQQPFPADVLTYEVWTPLQSIDEIVDITLQIDTKIAAIRAYESQCAVLRFDDSAEALARYRGELYSWPKTEGHAGRYAETFRRQRS